MSNHSFSWSDFEGVDCLHHRYTRDCAGCRSKLQAFVVEYQRLGPRGMRMKIWWIKLRTAALRLWVWMLGLWVRMLRLFLRFLQAIRGS
jgi:hypothetical protein